MLWLLIWLACAKKTVVSTASREPVRVNVFQFDFKAKKSSAIFFLVFKIQCICLLKL